MPIPTTDIQISKAEYETLAAFRYAVRQFLRFSEEAATNIGLPPQQYQALLAIQGFPGRDYVTIGELAERLQIQHHSAVGLVDRLVDQDLATREPGHDRRTVFVRLTRHGMDLLQQLATTHRDELRRIGPHLSTLLMRLATRPDR